MVTSNRELKFEDILLELRSSPDRFIEDESIVVLAAFIRGYQVARKEPSEMESRFISKFPSWLRARYGLKKGPQSWMQIILFYSLNEHDAYHHFFKLLDEFSVADDL